ncbi:5-hydroxytryptamine receptor 3A-like [Clinocottus analis]|uniref:5-hydroxytryptamine receptor 3A-like n=1 Tax=Clinocottus analis TaxID=304258 RepID=UPI0035C037DE
MQVKVNISKPPELNGSTNNYSEDLREKSDQKNNVRGTYLLGLDRSTTSDECSHRAVFKHLNLKADNEHTMVRPGDDDKPTEVTLDVLLFSILDVNEKAQQFVSYIWVDSWWNDYNNKWDHENFCGIKTIYPPTNVVWKPDIAIEEMTETNKAVSSPHLKIYSDGDTYFRSDMVVVSTCSMKMYLFPFDVQKCKLTFKSIVHSGKHLELKRYADSSWNTEWSLEKMAQSEWLFVNMTISDKIVNNFGIEQSVLVYTITMERRSALYIANFLLPILFFLALDLTSFLIPDNGGEKLGFKVTVLLAVTVMQLILNDILPSSSDSIPIISVYCIGVFGLMMLSLLETILMMYLLAKESASQDKEADQDQSLKMKKWTPCAGVCKGSVDETPSEQLSVTTEGDSSRPAGESIALEKISDELKEMEKTLTSLNSRKKERKPGYWARVAKIFNAVFFISYIITASVFLTYLFLLWQKPQYED